MLQQLTGISRYLSGHRKMTNHGDVQISTYSSDELSGQKDAFLSESDDGGFFSYLSGGSDQDEYSSQLTNQENEGAKMYFGQESENHSGAVGETHSDPENSMNCSDEGRQGEARSNRENGVGDHPDSEDRGEKSQTEKKKEVSKESRKEDGESQQRGYGLAEKHIHNLQRRPWKTDKEEMMLSKFHPGPLGRPIESSVEIQKTFSVPSLKGIKELKLEEIPGLKTFRCGTTEKGLPVVMMEIDSKKIGDLSLKLELASSGGLVVSMQSLGNGELPPELRDRLLKALKEADVELESFEMEGRGRDLFEGERERENRAYVNHSADDDLQVDEKHTPMQTLYRNNSNVDVGLFGKKNSENYLRGTIKKAIISLHERGCFSSGAPRCRVD